MNCRSSISCNDLVDYEETMYIKEEQTIHCWICVGEDYGVVLRPLQLENQILGARIRDFFGVPCPRNEAAAKATV